MDRRPSASTATLQRHGFVAAIVFAFEKIMPEPFSLSIGLTVIAIVLAVAFAPQANFDTVVTSWFMGMFGILAFALQMILILVTGFAIADAPPMKKGLGTLASKVKSPTGAASIVFPIVAVAAWLNWGLGLIVGALLAREIARNTRVDFAWLVAGSYSAWSICNSGLSSSIALSQASRGNTLNFVEKITGQVLPLGATILAPFVYTPTLVVVAVMAMIFIRIHPKDPELASFNEQLTQAARNPHVHPRGTNSFAEWIEQSMFGSVVLITLGVAYLVHLLVTKAFQLDINITILLFFLVGLGLQRTPVAYGDAIHRAAHQTGSMLLQYPIYGGIMGVMRGTGLASAIAKAFVAIATPASLPLWAFASSLIITFLIPSAGGHWAVDGPFIVPAALALHAKLPHAVMGVAMAENVSNMLQPFWAVPVVAIAGIKIQRVMGYTAITFAMSLVIYATALWLMP